MANQVFANGREVACKAGAGKTIASFPDVCMTPPENPGTPPGVPVPYPNTGFASDTTSGTKSIKISKKEVGLKNKSYFKKSTGDEAGCAAKKGVKSSKITGKVYFTSWSSDVKFEGKNVVRHLDTTTNNHGSNANEALPWPEIDTSAPPALIKKPCKKDCPKEPSKKRAKKLRRASPSKGARDKINQPSKKTCAACKGTPQKLAADHIVPLNIISKMPGFACLSEENQKKIANTPENFVGLCKSCNSSKCAKLWHTWTKHNKKGLDFTKGELGKIRKQARKVTNKSIINLKNKIKSEPCG